MEYFAIHLAISMGEIVSFPLHLMLSFSFLLLLSLRWVWIFHRDRRANRSMSA